MTVLVTVAGPAREIDLELDKALPVAELLPAIGTALGVSVANGLVGADGRQIAPESTLAEAGVLDGHRLRLEASASTTAALETPSHQDHIPAPVALPCYLALDTSDSMAGAALGAVNAELGRLVDALKNDGRAAACRLAVVTFDAEARVALPLTPVKDIAAPLFTATRPATNYEAAFRLLRRQIARDLDGLRMAALRPLRPAVFFLTDGRPTRGYWPAAHAALTDPGWEGSPDVIAFGFGGAAEHSVRRVGTAGAYLPAAAPGTVAVGPAGMLAAVMTFVLEALGHSATGLGHSATSLGFPVTGVSLPAEPPKGWRSLHELVP